MEEDDSSNWYSPPKIQPLDSSNIISHVPKDKYNPSDEYDPYGSDYLPKDRDTIIPYGTGHVPPDLGGHWHPQMPIPAAGDSQTGSIFPNMPAPAPIVAPPPAPSVPPLTLPHVGPHEIPPLTPGPTNVPFVLRGIGERTVNVFEDPGAFDTEIDDLIDGAYAENEAAGRVVTDEFVDEVGKKSLQQTLDEKQKSEFTPSFYTSPELKNLFPDDPEMAEIYSRAFDAHMRVFTPEGIPIPTHDIHELDQTLRLRAMAEIYRDLEAEGAEPMFVLSPNQLVPPFQWKQIYDYIARTDLPENPLGEPGFPPLEFIHPKIEQNWRALSQKEIGCPDIDGWTLRVMPTNREYNMSKSDETPVIDEIFMPTIPEFLTAQAVRIMQGLPPVLGKDTQTSSKNPLLLNRGITDLVVRGGYEHVTKSIQIGLHGHDATNPHPILLRVYMGGLTVRDA